MEFIIWKYKLKEKSDQEKSEDAKKDSNKKKEGK